MKKNNSRRNNIYQQSTTVQKSLPILKLVIAVVLLAAIVWDYWPTVLDLMQVWRRDQNDSGGAVVPLIALWLLWRERASLGECQVKACWWGIVVILLAHATRAFGTVFLYGSVERFSLVLTIAGVVLFVVGREVFRRIRFVLLFLFLMVPLPGRIHDMISGPLQTQATVGAVFFLELLGETVTSEGNVIVLDDNLRLGVAEACNGLSMLTAFIIVAALLVYIVNRPRWQKVALLVSSIPVAIACNVIRLVITAELYLLTTNEIADKFFHELAGVIMMPLALLILLGELVLLNTFVKPQDEAMAMTARVKAGVS